MGKKRNKERDEAEKQARKRLEEGTLKSLRSAYDKIIQYLEEEAENYYNISVYQMLPYPPNTKDPKDFFIERT